MAQISTVFWDKKNWLPQNYSWEDIKPFNNYELKYSLLYPIYIAIVIFGIRLLFDRFVAFPIARRFNLKDTSQRNFNSNPLLEVYFKDDSSCSESVLMHVARETGQSVVEIKSWLQARKLFNRPSKMKKFAEGFWRFIFYLCVWIYGLKVMYSKPWLWDTREYWTDYPKQMVPDDVYWYYTIELGYYMSLVVMQFFENKRKDFWTNFMHHIVTILLICLSQACNFTRTGSVVLLLHDSPNPWLHLAKLTIYLKMPKLCDLIFIGFAIVWFLTRVVLFPIRVIYSFTFELPIVVGHKYLAYYVFNWLLYALQVINLIWSAMIFRVAYEAILNGKIEKDARSESEPEQDHCLADDENTKTK